MHFSQSSNECYYFKVASKFRIKSHTHAEDFASDNGYFGVFPKERERFFMPHFCHIFSHDSQHFAMIPLTPSATKTIIFGSTTHFPCFGAKNEIYYSLLLFTCHYSPVTIHQYYSLLLFTQNFCLFKGGCPLYLKQVFSMLSSGLLPQREFSLESLSL